jgi:hypothetical protein
MPDNTPTGFPDESYIEVYSWPGFVEPSQLSLQLVANSTSVTSPFTGALQAEPMPGTRWKLVSSYAALDVDQVRAVRAIVAQLRGSSGRFYYLAEPGKGSIAPQPPSDNLAGVIAEGPRVVAVTGGMLQTTGWPQQDGELIARAGDYISADDARGDRHLFMLLADTYAQTEGAADFEVSPELDGLDFPAGAAIHSGGNASGQFFLADDSQGQITETPGGNGSTSIEAQEFRRPNVFRRTV